MSSKGGGTQGYRYLMSLLSGLCRGPIDELVEIQVGDKPAWNGHACNPIPNYIDAPELFGGDDKEGGIQGPFSVYMGAEGQVLPGAQGGLPDVKASIGGKVSEMRGVVTVWFDGLVAAMNPYLKVWKFRVRRTTKGWHNDNCWYPEKATIYVGGSSISIGTNRDLDLPVEDNVVTLTRNLQDGDSFTINGVTLDVVADNPSDFEITKGSNAALSAVKVVNYVNARATTFKATAFANGPQITFSADAAAQDIHAMNPSHLVFQCFTDPLWGRGLPWSELDENSFVYSANLFCSEGFGLALIWYRKEDIDIFIQKVVDLVGAVTYTDRETGKIVLRPIRNDYDIDTIPHFTPETGLVTITDDDAASADNSYNEVIGTSRDPITNLDFQVRAQNPAALQAQGAVSSLDQDYKGIPTKELLQRVTLRDLRAMASGLKKYNLSFDRRAWRIAPGSVIRISHPGRGIENLVLRVGEIDDGNMVNGEIKIKAAIDVFGLPATAYQGTVSNGWIGPSQVAAPAEDERLIEASYRDLYLELGAGDAQAMEPSTGFIGQLAVAPNSTSLEYDLLTKPAGGEYTNRGAGPFTGSARLAADITPLQTEITINSRRMFDTDNVGQALLIGDEIVRLDTLDEDAGTATITRGCGDTVPAAHDSLTLLWTIDDDLVTDGIDYAAGETVYAKVLTRTSSQRLDEAQAIEESVTVYGRHANPYPPADVRVLGLSIYEPRGEQPVPEITWVERNRITQADHLVGHTEAGVLAEDGTTYTIRVKDGDTLIREVTGIIDLTWTYTQDMIDEDVPPTRVTIELVAVRNERESTPYRFAVALVAGWGYGWGYSWGA